MKKLMKPLSSKTQIKDLLLISDPLNSLHSLVVCLKPLHHYPETDRPANKTRAPLLGQAAAPAFSPISVFSATASGKGRPGYSRGPA